MTYSYYLNLNLNLEYYYNFYLNSNIQKIHNHNVYYLKQHEIAKEPISDILKFLELIGIPDPQVILFITKPNSYIHIHTDWISHLNRDFLWSINLPIANCDNSEMR